jgi:hypothetical protein
LQLNYEVQFDRDQYDWNPVGGQDARPAYSNGALFLISRALFVHTPYGVATATVHLDVPEGWNVAAPWPELDGRPGSYLVESYDSLVSNVLVKNRYGDRGIPIDVADIQNAVSEVSGKDYSEFFTRYVHGREEMPAIEETLELAGIAVDAYGDEFHVRRPGEPSENQRRVYGRLAGMPPL